MVVTFQSTQRTAPASGRRTKELRKEPPPLPQVTNWTAPVSTAQASTSPAAFQAQSTTLARWRSSGGQHAISDELNGPEMKMEPASHFGT